MPKTNRPKLGDAAAIIAERLCQSTGCDREPRRDLTEARAQLVQALFDNDLGSEGLLFYKGPMDAGDWPDPKEFEWIPIADTQWSNRKVDQTDATERSYKLDYIEIDWETHSFKVREHWEETRSFRFREHEDGKRAVPAAPPTGFCEIRLLQTDIDRIWPPTATIQTESSDQHYETEWLRLMRQAIAHFKITEENQPLADELRDWFSSQTADGQRVSANMAKAMATFVRLPKYTRGGNRPFARR
jgi:hypothetical protein